jgi:hypothetical protein
LIRTTLSCLPAVFTALAVAQTPAPLLTAFPPEGAVPPAPWHVAGLPRQKKPFTRFSLVDLDGRRALRVEASESYGHLVHPLAGLPPGARLAWSWHVDEPLADADLRNKNSDDTAIKVCAFFDLPLDRVPFLERQLLRFARSQSTEQLPAAAVCYVWDSRLPVGTAIDNAFTRRVRYLVLQSGPAQPHQWPRERRDLAADFTRLFGAESPQVPPLVGVAVGADADNTHGHSVAHVADLVLEP